MTLTLEIPEEYAQKLTRPGKTLSQTCAEAAMIEWYRMGAITPEETRKFFCVETHEELDAIFKGHGVTDGATQYKFPAS